MIIIQPAEMDRETSLDTRERHEKVCQWRQRQKKCRFQGRGWEPSKTMSTHLKSKQGHFQLSLECVDETFVIGSTNNKALIEIHDHVCGMILSTSQEVSCLLLQNLCPEALTSGTLLFDLRNGSPGSQNPAALSHLHFQSETRHPEMIMICPSESNLPVTKAKGPVALNPDGRISDLIHSHGNRGWV